MKKNSFKNSQKGFTLIEMIVSLGIFTIVALIAVGALLKILDANRKALNLKNTVNNMNFALESLSREMRPGRSYYYSSAATDINPSDLDSYYNSHTNTGSVATYPNVVGGWTIAFYSSKTSTVNPPVGNTSCNLVYAYRFTGYTVPNGVDDYKLQKAQQTTCDDTLTSSDFQDLTSPSVKITNTVVRVDNRNGLQPMAMFWFSGYSKIKAKDEADFSMQTTISQRIK